MWLRMLRAQLPILRDLEPDERPLPRVGVGLGWSVPGWVLRTAAALATGALLGIATRRAGLDPAFGWTVTVIATAFMAFWPGTGVASVALVISGLVVAVDGRGPFDPVVFGLIPLGYAAVRLAWWAERVSVVARVELAALARGLGRWAAVTAGTLAFGVVAFALAGRPSALALVAGGAALIAVVWLVSAARRV
jgi:hypothetical protein